MQHLDEGEIHAWLDGQLPADEAARMEQHTSQCVECEAAVAQARGFIAASSRILTQLDNVPPDVVPVRKSVSPVHRRRWFDGPTLRAAVVLLAVGGGALVTTRVMQPPLSSQVELQSDVASAPQPATAVAPVLDPDATVSSAGPVGAPPVVRQAVPGATGGMGGSSPPFTGGRDAQPPAVADAVATEPQRQLSALANEGPPAPAAAAPASEAAVARERLADAAKVQASREEAAVAMGAAAQSRERQALARRSLAAVASDMSTIVSTHPAVGCYRLTSPMEGLLELRSLRDGDRFGVLLRRATAVERGWWTPASPDSIDIDLPATYRGRALARGDSLSGTGSGDRKVIGQRAACRDDR
jgi:hypothetical protein